jgi:hypothetical protein
VTAGSSWERDEFDLATWCLADVAIPGSSDLGSPGLANGICVFDTADTATP